MKTQLEESFEEVRKKLDSEKLDLFWTFIHERQNVWQKRVCQKLPYPWTDDPILQKERFTNIYRELDPGTQYAIMEILEKEEEKSDKIFNVMFYRLIGKLETHQAIGFMRVSSYNQKKVEECMTYIRDVQKEPPFTAAYMVGGYTKMGFRDKIKNVTALFTEIAKNFSPLYSQIERSQSSEEIFHIIKSVYGFGQFLSYQVLVDLLYPLECYEGQPLLPYSHNDWACAGPGAQRGIRMLTKTSYKIPDLTVLRWLQSHQQKEFKRLKLDFSYLENKDGERQDISLANIQNCLCEFHKYVKIGEGTGKGRRKFKRGPSYAVIGCLPTKNLFL